MSGNDSCGFDDGVTAIRNVSFYIVYYGLTVISTVCCCIGHSLLLAAFARSWRLEHAYMYQILYSCCKIVGVVVFSTLYAPFKKAPDSAAVWYAESFAASWFSATIPVPLLNSLTTSELLLSVTIAADRVFAIGKPFLYKQIHSGRHQTAAAVICFSVGFATSLFDCFRFRIRLSPDGRTYKNYVNEQFVDTLLAAFLAHFRTAVRFVALLALIGCNFALIILLRKHRRNVLDKLHQQQQQQDRSSRSSERLLATLNTLQSLFTTLAIVPLLLFYVAAYVWPSFTSCWGNILTPSVDGILVLTDTLHIVANLTLSRRLRQEIRRSLTCCSRKTNPSVDTATGTIVAPRNAKVVRFKLRHYTNSGLPTI